MEQEKELKPIQRLHRAISLIEINDLYALKSSFELYVPPLSITPEKTVLRHDQMSSWDIDEKRKILTCSISRKITGFEKSKFEDDVFVKSSDDQSRKLSLKLFEFSAIINVIYLIKEDDIQIDDVTFRIFTETNAVFNSYPYFREFFHSQSARMGMHPIVLPFLKPLNVKDINEKYSKVSENEIADGDVGQG
ncbi:MAG: hypothetical protein COV37_16465 [Bdellovibrio sp. CG11_big_fil_rev_8_21_14_0_20_39_38]|nr:MAG: hypothetical protein COW78_14935 [Bdellovibrio sp. CG22_combo_CG10-13_8_21_14_all_39_27]PIR33373.1 MAG: hypothetical protein COV37_16465 [Bdellovibrio sp. CG11_big_fil_rev_8_21_14_0_20_39_38]